MLQRNHPWKEQWIQLISMLSYLKTATHVSVATALIGQQTWTWRQDPPPAEKFHLPEGSGDIYYLLTMKYFSIFIFYFNFILYFNLEKLSFFIRNILFIYLLSVQCGMWSLSSLNRGWTCAPYRSLTTELPEKPPKVF